MKLIIKRSQDKGFLGGIKFKLSCRVDLTQEEKGLIDKYKAYSEVLTTKQDGSAGITVNDLMKGVEYKLERVNILLNNEEVIKDACKSFKNLLEVMASFGGEEVMEI